MRLVSRAAAAVLLGTALTATAQPPATPPAGLPTPAPVAPPAGAAPARKVEPRPPGNAATVNNQPIAEAAVYRALRQFPPAHHELARKEILNHLVENTLIDQYLIALKVEVPEKEVEDLIGELKKDLVAGKKDYAQELEAMMLTEAEFRAEVLAQLKWEKFVKQQGTDAALKQTFDASPDVFDGTMVRARHVLLTPGADPAKQQEAKGKLLGIKQVVEGEAAKAVAAQPATADALAKEQARTKKTDELFAAYAKQYSACPSGEKSGGDLNYFPRAGAMLEPFAKAAFALKPYQMSEVVETDYGYHLILVTDRKAGAKKEFKDVVEDVRLVYAMRLREAVVGQMKPRAQIVITPAPAAAPAAGTTPDKK